MYRCNMVAVITMKDLNKSIVRFLCEKHFLLDNQKIQKKKHTKTVENFLYKNCWKKNLKHKRNC